MSTFSINKKGSGKKNSGLRISILSPSDSDDNLFRRLQWGDYWVKYKLTKALGIMGYLVTDKKPDTIIHLLGTPIGLPKKAFKIIWIYSHPEKINPKLLKKYDKIFCLSSSFNKKIREWGFDSEVLYGATAKKIFKIDKYDYDILFVGNNRLNGIRQIVQDVGDTPYNFKVWGKGWEGKIDKRYIGGQYIDYVNLNEYYARSRITLNDHSLPMREEGFVAIRIYDILASGGFCISDKNHGIEEIFCNTVPQYESAEHLKELIDYYIEHEEERQMLMKKGRKLVSNYTWMRVAERFASSVSNIYK